MNKKTKKKTKKREHPGQPTKYKGTKTIETVDGIIADMSLETFFLWCGVENVAHLLAVCRDTIYEWRSKHIEFDAVMKRWETKRNALFYTLSLRLAPGVWIFLAKNWLGLKDRFDIEGAMTSEVYQYISHIPSPKKAEPKKEEEIEEKNYKEIDE